MGGAHAGTAAAAAGGSTRLLHRDSLERWSGFDVGIEQAVTLPASWYTSPAVLQLEKQQVLYKTWQMVCSVSQLQQPGDFVCGSLADVRYLLVRGQDGQLRAFHNVCRHHAAAVAQGCGSRLQFECPYHSWTYDDCGRLVKATRLKGIKNFKAAENGLHPIHVDIWGQMVFLHLGGAPAAAAEAPPGVADWLAAGGARMAQLGMADADLCHIARREYVLNCNWKVFCDNFLDGGYHVPHAHKGLASGLELSSYRNELYETVSVQSCAVRAAAEAAASGSSSNSSSTAAGAAGAAPQARLAGRDAGYAFVYPNLMVNRYGPWMDTNVVRPLTGSSTDQCKVVFDYFLEKGVLSKAAAADADSSSSSSSRNGAGLSDDELEAGKQSQFVAEALSSSHQVQVEDIGLCEAVQLGLQEPAYGVGRYAPGPEAPMYHFHKLLYADVMNSVSAPLAAAG